MFGWWGDAVYKKRFLLAGRNACEPRTMDENVETGVFRW